MFLTKEEWFMNNEEKELTLVDISALKDENHSFIVMMIKNDHDESTKDNKN